MSSKSTTARYRRAQRDRAIHTASLCLAGNDSARSCFFALLSVVRERAPRLMEATPIHDRHPGVEALVHLARFHGNHLRQVSTWPGCEDSWRVAVSSLAHHLVGDFHVPRFLSAAWFATDEVFAEQKRYWFLQHSQGASFRSLKLPLAMTRRMESMFLSSSDHFGIEFAMRLAELRGLGAKRPLIDAILASPVALDLRNGDFWRTAWLFLIREQNDLDLQQVAPMLDFFQAIRHERTVADTAAGPITIQPPHPAFSLEGRTTRSVYRLMQRWHRNLGEGSETLRWKQSEIQPMVVEDKAADPSIPPVVWEFTELTNSAELRAEGRSLQHCVASYSYACWSGRSRIWSLRRRRNVTYRPVLTVEIQARTRTIVQARGFRNRMPSGRARHILEMWASKEGLKMAV